MAKAPRRRLQPCCSLRQQPVPLRQWRYPATKSHAAAEEQSGREGNHSATQSAERVSDSSRIACAHTLIVHSLHLAALLLAICVRAYLFEVRREAAAAHGRQQLSRLGTHDDGRGCDADSESRHRRSGDVFACRTCELVCWRVSSARGCGCVAATGNGQTAAGHSARWRPVSHTLIHLVLVPWCTQTSTLRPRWQSFPLSLPTICTEPSTRHCERPVGAVRRVPPAEAKRDGWLSERRHSNSRPGSGRARRWRVEGGRGR